jgi:hypothetical protein
LTRAYSGTCKMVRIGGVDYSGSRWTHPDEGIKSPPSQPPMLGILCVKSTQGLTRLAPAGIGKPISLITIRSEMTIPAPAESPIRMMDVGRIGAWAPGGGSRR